MPDHSSTQQLETTSLQEPTNKPQPSFPVLGKWAKFKEQNAVCFLPMLEPPREPESKRVVCECILEKQSESCYGKSARLGIRVLVIALFLISYMTSHQSRASDVRLLIMGVCKILCLTYLTKPQSWFFINNFKHV